MIFLNFIFPCFSVFLTTCGPHHCWPTPLLAQTSSWPRQLFDQTFLCPAFCEPSLTPSLGQFVAQSCFSGPRTTQYGNCCCCVTLCGVVVWCVNAVCVPDFSWVHPRFGRYPRLSFRGTPLRRTDQNFALFFPLPHNSHLSSLSWRFSWN